MKKMQIPEGKKKYLVLGLLFLLGLGLLLGGNLGSSGEEAVETSPRESAREYQERLTREVESLCRDVAGVGKVTVLIRLSGGYEYVYARDGDGDYFGVGSGSKKEAVIEQVLPPTVAGIGIVCEGGDSAAVRQTLTELLSAALGIGANKIYITS